ncbi:alpha/beta hydrolase [Oharaeibacter diazotrophicus]|uniref:Phospholipase/carboxylesterase n=1 Tax=Oharaeibacter diazotrophicus TaxID=1920512 RepID=A0A4R6RD76_9HYPH|nr:dienelactone hydrolase family protein [Oharaeibacter diazotrophicus]TDP84082.1 phospholipase/carboxylesterase [Oharaeibacter diazotrophicus]BBE73121.1 carboxylesterase 2 [Pleomorphomonas sp. SM30]GLS74910.1 phospholipase [Oharaeibacter diazotrophicus]
MTRIDGPRLPATGGPATALVVFLHGYGADGNDLIDIGAAWQPHLPGVAFVSPHAPEPCAMSPMGRQWFPLTLRDDTERWRGVVHARPALDAFLDAERDRLGVTDDRIVLVGFSQGTMMALHVGLRRPALAAIVGYSGLLAGPEHLDEATARPKVTLIHGDQDQVLPVQFTFAAASALGAAGIPAEFHVSKGIGHGIDQRGLVLGLETVAGALGIALPRR